jgi:hypothetical protein
MMLGGSEERLPSIMGGRLVFGRTRWNAAERFFAVYKALESADPGFEES